MPLESVSIDRLSIRKRLTAADLRALGDAPRGVTVQFDSTLPHETFETLDREFFAHRPDAEFRVYAHHGKEVDLSFLGRMPSLVRFSADCLWTARGVEWVTRLPRLRDLAIDILDLKDFAFLADLPVELEHLSLGETNSKRPSIASISRFPNLRTLMLDKQHKGLDAVGELHELRELRLWHYSKPDLSFLGRLPKLRRLQVNLGGGPDFSAIGGATGLRELELCWIRGLEDISFVRHLVNLELLIIDRMAGVRQVPDLSTLARLKELRLLSLRRLESVKAVATGPALELLRYFPGESGRLAEDLEAVLDAPSLRNVRTWIGNRARREAFATVARERGIEARVG